MNVKKDIDQKIVGYALLVVGLCIMGYCIFSVFNVFGGGNVPFEILVSETGDADQNLSQGDIDIANMSISDINLNLEQVITPLYPMFNLTIWLAIAFFLVIAGGRVASLGIKMLKASLPELKVIKSERTEKKERNMKVEDSGERIEQEQDDEN